MIAVMLAMLFAVVPGAVPQPAAAFPGQGTCADALAFANFKVTFTATSGSWSSVIDGASKQFWATQGFDSWEVALRPNGSKIVNIGTSLSSGVPVEIKLVSTVNPNEETVLGNTSCTGTPLSPTVLIRIRSDVADGTELKWLVAHEMGHALGLKHTGDDDQPFSGTDFNVMATCKAFESRTMDADDLASLAFQRLPDEPMTAGAGLEEDVSGAPPTWWDREYSNNNATLQFEVNSGGTHNAGYRHLNWKPNDLYQHIETRTFHVPGTPAGSVVDEFEFYGWFRQSVSGTATGGINVVVEARSFDYGTPNNTNCVWPSASGDYDWNQQSFPSPATWSPVSFGYCTAPTTNTYKKCETTNHVAQPEFNYYRVRIWSSVQNSAGNYLLLNFDDSFLRPQS